MQIRFGDANSGGGRSHASCSSGLPLGPIVLLFSLLFFFFFFLPCLDDDALVGRDVKPRLAHGPIEQLVDAVERHLQARDLALL